MTAQHTNALQQLLVDGSFEGDVYPNEPMSRHTSYRIGGNARFYVQVFTLSALTDLLSVCEENLIEWVIVGKGSNLLVSDEGFAGVVITLGDDFRSYVFDEERSCFIVGAGFTLGTLVQEAFKRSLAGLEFAVGTPGTVGGALRMNAGSRDEWIGSRVISVTTFVPGQGLKRYLGSDIEWSYRSSSFGPEEVIVECEIAVESNPTSYIRGKMEAQLAKRKKSQPLNLPSCGSVFKNPPQHSAGAMIEEVGLKGFAIGGAQVSELHANFIVNTGGARARDVVDLIVLVQEKVKESYGIELQPEVRFLGFA
ncbi:MAG: UDP-N-acetylmuramate dehydrogenase [Raoultibacter sp.]|jgi:UDP-N-acetylmuramate dehydrogenase